jgi:hypothetical protein
MSLIPFVHSASQLEGRAGFCFEPIVCSDPASTEAAGLSVARRSGRLGGAGTISAEIAQKQQER